jgi:hypothetical protein
VRGTHITVGLPLALVLTGCSEEPLSLIDLAPAGESVETVGGRRALTPGFPSDLTFRVRLPEEPFLDFSVAVLASKEVGRGSVAFSVRLDDEGQRFTVYEEIIRARVGRTFQSRRVNLAAWRGKEVALILGAEPAHPEAVGAWVEEVQVAWGEPRVENRPLVPAVAQPSIVLILVDTLRRDYLGFHGFEGPISPNLDWLAKESVMFENAFTQAPWTKPSIASLFTSLHPDTHGLDNHEGLFGHRQNQALTTGVLPAEAVTKHREGVHAVRTDRYKLIFDGKTGSVSLFDLEADPGEYRDIASEKAVEAQKLLALLSRHIEESRRFRLHPQNAIIPDEIRKRLESLGYLKKTK